MITRDDFPEDPSQLDEWMKAVDEFNKCFESLIQGVVYLYGLRDRVATDDLRTMSHSVLGAFQHICKENCGRDFNENDDECKHCPFYQHLVKLKWSDDL